MLYLTVMNTYETQSIGTVIGIAVGIIAILTGAWYLIAAAILLAFIGPKDI